MYAATQGIASIVSETNFNSVYQQGESFSAGSQVVRAAAVFEQIQRMAQPAASIRNMPGASGSCRRSWVPQTKSCAYILMALVLIWSPIRLRESNMRRPP